MTPSLAESWTVSPDQRIYARMQEVWLDKE
jgi:hypothetical protein